MSNRTENLPLLPLRDVVIFPSVVTPLFVGREKSIIALQASMASDKQIMLVAQKEAQNDNPQGKDVYEDEVILPPDTILYPMYRRGNIFYWELKK